MKELTEKQQKVLDFVKDFVSQHKYPPSVREVAAEFDISVKGAHDHLKALEKKGSIRSNNNRSRSIEVLEEEKQDEDFLTIPVLGHVAAGVPIFSEENFDGTLKLHAEFLPLGNLFALYVQGDSMQDVGIIDGDLAVVQQKTTANNGDIVIALVNDEAVTLKRFYKEKNRIKLKAENPVYPPIYSQNVKILGKLIRIIRDYE